MLEKGAKKEREPGPTPLFPLGSVSVAPNTQDALEQAGVAAATLVARHARGDWGEEDPGQWRANRLALEFGGGLTSTYRLATGVEVGVYTEPDASATTVFLWDPEEG